MLGGEEGAFARWRRRRDRSRGRDESRSMGSSDTWVSNYWDPSWAVAGWDWAAQTMFGWHPKALDPEPEAEFDRALLQRVLAEQSAE